MTTWRDQIRPIVAAIIERDGGLGMRALRKSLVDNRPYWVAGASHQTKIWRDEVNQQLGIKAEREAAKRRQEDERKGQQFIF